MTQSPLLWPLAGLARNKYVAALGWFLFAFNHSALAAVAFVAWLPIVWASSRTTERPLAIRKIAVGFLGLVLGSGCIALLTNYWGGVTSRAEVFAVYGFDYFWNALVAGSPYILFTALGAGWIILLDRRVRSSLVARILLAEAVACSVALPILAWDQTRTIGLALSAAVFAWVAKSNDEYGVDVLTSVWRRYAIACAIVPVILVVGGEFDYSGVQAILHWRAALQ